jgi:hypothetical protein
MKKHFVLVLAIFSLAIGLTAQIVADPKPAKARKIETLQKQKEELNNELKKSTNFNITSLSEVEKERVRRENDKLTSIIVDLNTQIDTEEKTPSSSTSWMDNVALEYSADGKSQASTNLTKIYLKLSKNFYLPLIISLGASGDGIFPSAKSNETGSENKDTYFNILNPKGGSVNISLWKDTLVRGFLNKAEYDYGIDLAGQLSLRLINGQDINTKEAFAFPNLYANLGARAKIPAIYENDLEAGYLLLMAKFVASHTFEKDAMRIFGPEMPNLLLGLSLEAVLDIPNVFFIKAGYYVYFNKGNFQSINGVKISIDKAFKK